MINKKKFVTIIVSMFVFLGLFIFGGCQNNNTTMDVPENHLEVQLLYPKMSMSMNFPRRYPSD